MVNTLVFAPATGRLESLEIGDTAAGREHGLGVVDVSAEAGDEVDGPDRVFATVLADAYIAGRDLKHARRLSAEVLGSPPRVS